MITKVHKLKILVTVLFFSQLFMQSSSAVDLSDTTPPAISLQLQSSLPSPGNTLVFKLKVTDDRNEIVAQNFTIALFAFFRGEKLMTLAPLCTQEQSQRELLAEIIPITPAGTRNGVGQYEQSFYLIAHIPRLLPLPEGCPEWREAFTIQGWGRSLSNIFKDAAGNKVSGIDVLYSDISFTTSYSTSNLVESNYCFLMLRNENWLQTFSTVEERFRTKIAIYKSEDFAKPIFQKINSNYGYLNYLENYLSFSKKSFDLDSFRSLPLCSSSKMPLSAGASFPLSFGTIETVVKPVVDSLISETDSLRSKLTSRQTVSTITCVKGKLTKKVTAVNPKCPKGYKKR